MRYFLKLAYNGAGFHGWQSQPNAVGVQQVVEDALSVVTRNPVSIFGAGRTDAGVHAREMYAHFDIPFRIEDKGKMLLSLNRLSGKDISILDLIEVEDDAHARFDATERTYKYFVSYIKSPFVSQLSWHSPTCLDIDRMNEAASLLLDTEDFTSFAKLHSDTKTNICDVRMARWDLIHGGNGMLPVPNFLDEGLVFTISADRFLRNMVRSIVGTLVDVGRGKISPRKFKEIIDSRDRCVAGTSMPAQGLFLWDVKYPYIS